MILASSEGSFEVGLWMLHGSVLSELGALQQWVVVWIAQPGNVAVLEPTVAGRACLARLEVA